MQTLSFDLALYYNDYRDLITSSQPVPEVLPTEILLHLPFINGPAAETHGAELSAKWRPISSWELSAGVTELRGSTDAVQASPQHGFNLQSHLDLPHKTEFSTALYYCGEVPPGGTPPSPLQNVPSFARVDIGASWHVRPQWTFAVWGRNLQSDAHRETRDTTIGNQAGDVPRAVVFKLLWQSKPESVGSK